MVAAQGYAEDFKNGPLCLAEKGELVIDLTGKDDVENSTDAASLFAFNPEVATLFLKHIPAEVKREDLLEKLTPLAGFVALQMSRPLMNHSFDRLAWATFKSEHESEQALHMLASVTLGGFKLSAIKCQPGKGTKSVRVSPALPEKQAKYDLHLCKKLIRKVLDPES